MRGFARPGSPACAHVAAGFPPIVPPFDCRGAVGPHLHTLPQRLVLGRKRSNVCCGIELS